MKILRQAVVGLLGWEHMWKLPERGVMDRLEKRHHSLGFDQPSSPIDCLCYPKQSLRYQC